MVRAMELLKEYIALCFFKNNPTDLQPSWPFIWKNLLLYLGLGLLIEASISDIVDGTIEILVKAFLALLLIFSLLLFTKKLHLFTQALTAFIVCENVILFLGVLTEILDVVIQQTEFAPISIALAINLGIWLIAIITYLLKQIFSFQTVKSVSLAIFYCVFTIAGPFVFTELI